MKRTIHSLLMAILAIGTSVAEPIPDDRSVKTQLMWFLGTEETAQRINELVEQLDADSFAEREAASRELAALPSLPAFVRGLARTHDRGEVRSRLGKIAKLRPVEKETIELDRILKQIGDDGTKDTLGILVRILQAEVWSPDKAALGRAARATVTEADLPLLRESLTSPSVSVRRLVASACSGLPHEQSSAALAQLLDDPDDSVALLVAEELARRKDPACLRAFARLLDAPAFATRHRSWSALKGLTEKAFGFDPSATEDARKAAAGDWQEWARQPGADITGALPESSAIALFNGRDLSGWKVYEAGRPAAKPTTWEARDDSLVSVGMGFGDIRTTAAFENYVLTLQYKIDGPAGDGGVGVMLNPDNEGLAIGAMRDTGQYIEVQILPNRGGDLYLIGGFKAQADGKPISFSSRRTAEVDDPAGKWHQLKLTVKDGELEVEINGTVVNRASKGRKGPGKIVLRNEGDLIAYKGILLHPIDP